MGDATISCTIRPSNAGWDIFVHLGKKKMPIEKAPTNKGFFFDADNYSQIINNIDFPDSDGYLVIFAAQNFQACSC
jgi:hypothetical protein